MSAKGWPWSALDLPSAPATTAEVRRAYAKKLKTIDQAADIAGFEALRNAYENALARVEHKARKAATLVEMAPRKPETVPVPDIAPEPAPPPPPVGDSPETALPVAALLSREECLAARLRGLAEGNILVSVTERARQILEDPDFRSPDLEPQLRDGFAQYIRSQLLFNHLNEPYLRHPGVTADLLKALDARFGWLSDYNAFRRDFHSDSHLLEAMVDAVGVDRTPPPRPPYPTNSRGRLGTRHLTYGSFFVVGYIMMLSLVVEESARAPDNAVLFRLKVLMSMILFVALFGILGLFLGSVIGWLTGRRSSVGVTAREAVVSTGICAAAILAFVLLDFALR